ncbi:hypothetical protein ACJJIW_09385 [Microbulbifer sp. JMSA004]|uniref:hypothetical protein n=1 Tax=unclassified Microbulbifer TaxID=2619833 RepID=UPI00403B3776
MGNLTLADVLNIRHKNKLHYENVYCSFCRSEMSFGDIVIGAPFWGSKMQGAATKSVFLDCNTNEVVLVWRWYKSTYISKYLFDFNVGLAEFSLFSIFPPYFFRILSGFLRNLPGLSPHFQNYLFMTNIKNY